MGHKECGVKGGDICNFKKVAREGLTGKVTIKQKLEGDE